MRSSTTSNGVSLVIRYDDYGAAYLPSCGARLAVEQMLHDQTVAHGWPWVNAITPLQSVDTHNVHETRTVHLVEDPPRVALLRDMMAKGCCEPAVHGLTHHTWKQLPRYGTEFAGLPLDRQTEILRTAKSEVEGLTGRSVGVFVPPWNSYDEATVEAAGEVGLTLVSTGLMTFVPGAPPVDVVPATVELIHLRQIMDAGHQYPPGSVLVILLHGTDFVGVDREIGYLQPEEFGPLIERAERHFHAHVVPVTSVPRLIGSELPKRSSTAALLTRRRDDLPDLPVVGKALSDWLLPHVSALVPAALGTRARVMLSATLAAWFVAVALLALIPGSLIAAMLEPGAVRSAATFALGLTGLAVIFHCGRNGWVKVYRGHWGAREVGVRTWTGVVIGAALVCSSFIAWLLTKGLMS